MKDITIYTTSYCGYCENAKRFFQQKSVSFKEVDITEKHELRDALSKKHSWRTVPMIFIGDEFVGGFQELIKLDSKGDLEKKLNNE